MPVTFSRLFLSAALVCVLVCVQAPAVHAEEDALISRDVLFGNPDRAGLQLSPDGTALAFLAPLDGVMNIWVAPLDDTGAARAVTADKGRGIQRYRWCYDNRHLLYLQDDAGNENWRLNALDLITGAVRHLSPESGVTARIEGLSPQFPGEALVALNDRDPRFHDIHRVEIATGKKKLVQQNDGFLGFITDDAFRVRFAARPTPTGGNALFRKNAEGAWEPWQEAGPEDAMTTGPMGFDKSGKLLYMRDSRGRDTAALTIVDLTSGESTVLFESKKADIAGLSVHPTEKYIEAVSVNYERAEWTILDPRMKADFERLGKVDDGDPQLASRSLDDKHWIVAFTRSDGPVRYFHYDRDTQKARFLFTNRTDLEKVQLARMEPVQIKSRDGLTLVSYLTLPRGVARKDLRPEKSLPLVLLVHGGPWARDRWGYNPLHQLLANRGYAVLSVNFRGSTGFGKAFLNAANLQWGRKMHDDLLDAVEWAVAQGIADPQKVAIMGGSYGGYATLIGLTLTPDTFACGIDIVGPSNLNTLIATIPPYWSAMRKMFATRVGDPDTEAGRKLLKDRSPLTHVANIKRPLLIGQGKNDPRVKEAEAQQIVDAMMERQIPVTYVLYPDEGHGFRRPANSKSFFAIVEAFLSQNLGGRYEPFGDDLVGASLQVPVGGLWVPGLGEALKRRATK